MNFWAVLASAMWKRRHWAACSAVAATIVCATAPLCAAEANPNDRVIMLPPLIVEEMRTGPRWRYAQAAGYEVLARCDDAPARSTVAAYHRARAIVRSLVPDRFLVNFDVPNTLILYDENLWPAKSHDAIASILGHRHRVEEQSTSRAPLPQGAILDPLPFARVVPGRADPADRAVVFLRNVRLSDDDAVVSFALVPRRGIDVASQHLTAQSLGDLLGRRTPALPGWFVAGLLSIYGQLDFSRSEIEAPALVWLSRAETLAARRAPHEALLPIADLFRENAIGGQFGPAVDPRVWLAQAELWVRWGLAPGEPARTEAFLAFVERAATGPVDESAFRASFGRSYAEGRAELAAFLPVAVSRSMRWPVVGAYELPDIVFRDATRAEVARIKGDWERLEVRYVREHQPELAGRYAANARKTLSRGGRDPAVLAVMGLAEIEDGNEAAAAKHLEIAAAAEVIRPRAHYERARLRFRALRDRSRRDDGKLSLDEARQVIDALAPALAQAPPLAQSYALLADVWLHTAAAPGPDDFALLDQGLAAFPRRAELFYRVARLNYESGAVERGDELVEAGLRIADTAARIQQLRGLQANWHPDTSR